MKDNFWRVIFFIVFGIVWLVGLYMDLKVWLVGLYTNLKKRWKKDA